MTLALFFACAPETPDRGGAAVDDDPVESRDEAGEQESDDEEAEDDELPEVEDDEDDDAVVADAWLPDALGCGEAFVAEVEVTNTGAATWTREEGYKLGAVDDADPFFGEDPRVWLDEDDVVLPGERHVFAFELTAPASAGTYTTDWRMVHEHVQWFGETVTAEVEVACTGGSVWDPLTSASVQPGFADKDVDGGSFSSAGWQVTGNQDQLVLVLDQPITGPGTLEIDVTNFDPHTQYASDKHQVLNLYTSGDGSQAVFDSDEAWWNLRTGTNYGTGVKFLASGRGGDERYEERCIEDASWDPSDVHTWRVVWDDSVVDLYLDGTRLSQLPFDGRISPLQYVFLGKDNVYVSQVGPIWSNLRVTWE